MALPTELHEGLSVQSDAQAMSPDIWHRMCDAIEDPIFLHDPDYRLLFANGAYFRAAGMAPAEAIGKFYWEVFPRGDGPLPGCRATHEGGSLESVEEFTAGGRRFLSRGFELRDATGAAEYSLHVLRDITAQRQTEDHLARVHRLYRTISQCNQVLVRSALRRSNVIPWARVGPTAGGGRSLSAAVHGARL